MSAPHPHHPNGDHMTTTRTPQTRPAVAIRQATRILGTDEDGVARLVKSGTLTEMYTRPTSGSPEAIYNVTELEALAAVERLRAELDQPCGSCHPCTNYRDETWRAADRKPPHVHEWDEASALLRKVKELAFMGGQDGESIRRDIQQALHDAEVSA